MKTNKRKTTAIILLLLVAFLALYGGWMLIADPSGQSLQFPIAFLENTPFKDYLIPGILLFLFIGIFYLITALFTFFKIKNYAWLIILSGCILIGWLCIEVILNPAFFFPAYHYPLYIIAVILIIIGYFERKYSMEVD